MRVEKINDEMINIYLNTFNFKNIDVENKIELVAKIKEILSKVEQRYKVNFNGFYKVKVYPNKKIGVFLNILKIDDNEFSSGADFRIIVYLGEKFLLETSEYEQLDKNIEKRVLGDRFYIDLDHIKEINKVIDLGNVIYGEDTEKILKESKLIK